MKKIIFAAALIIIIAGVGIPLVRGLMLERIVKQSFSDINQVYADTGSDVSIEIQRYDRHFLSSRIEWRIKFGRLSALYGIDDIIFLDHADHGFTSIVSETSLEKNIWFTHFVNTELNGKNPLKIKTEYTLSGRIQSNIALDTFSFKAGSDSFEILPGTMVVMLDKGVENIRSEMTWKGCFCPGKLKIDRFFLNSNLKRITPFIWDGNVSLTVKNINAVDKEKVFDLSNVRNDYIIDYRGEENSLSIGMGSGADTIRFGKDTMEKAFVQMNINQLDAQGYEALLKIVSQAMGQAAEQIAAADPDTMETIVENQMAAIGFQMLKGYEKLLKKGLELQISDVRAQFPQGDLKGEISLSLKKDMIMAQFIPLFMKPSMAVDILHLESKFNLPYTLLDDKKALLLPLYPGMQTGLFIKDGDNLVHTAETINGRLFLNGKEVMFN